MFSMDVLSIKTKTPARGPGHEYDWKKKKNYP